MKRASLILAFFILSSVALYAAWHLVSVESTQATQGHNTRCGFSPVRVSLGDEVFTFEHPKGRRTISIEYADPNIRLWPCQKPDAPPLPAKSIFLLITDLPPYSDPSRINGRGFVVALSIAFINYEFADSSERVNKILSEKQLKMDGLPVKDGFRVLQYSPVEYYFIPEKGDMHSPFEEKVIVHCQKLHIKRETMQCGFKFRWKKDLYITANEFTTDYIPPSEWGSLYKTLVNRVETNSFFVP